MMSILLTIIRLYEAILFIRIIMSWIQPDPNHPVVEWIYRLTEPVLAPIRRLLPTRGMGIDFSPLVVFLILHLLQSALRSGMYY